MKVLIMGGNQFLGRSLCEELVSLNYEVFVLNRGNRENVSGAKHIKADRNNYNDLEKALKDLIVDIVVDISAYTPSQVEIFYKIMKKKFKQYILISSASIYNNIKEFPVSEEASTGKNIIWGEYAENKYLAELETRKMKEHYTIFRPFYIYGIGNNLDREQYIFSRIEYDLPVYIPNTGENIVQFGYIDDLVAAIIYSFNNPKFYNQNFNISGDKEISIRNFVELCAKVMNKKVEIKYIKCDTNIKARDWFPFRASDLYGNIQKLKTTGFKNKYNLEQGLMKTYNYLKKNNLLKYPELKELKLKNSIYSKNN